MTETNTNFSPESQEVNDKSVEGLFKKLIDLDPKFVKKYVPSDGDEQKNLFLSGEIRNPIHHYDQLETIDFAADQASIEEVGQSLLSHEDLNPKFATAYEHSVVTYQKKTRLMELATLYAKATGEEQAQLKNEYMNLNIELYGKPDESIYRQIIAEKLQKIQAKELSEEAKVLLAEVIESVGEVELEEKKKFTPSEETVNWMHSVAESLYGEMLTHVPEQDSFTSEEAQAVFTEILAEEFGATEDGWKVDVEKATSITVKAEEKRIVIPTGRKILRTQMRKLVVHEIGVHFLRSVNGEQTDLGPLRHGGLDNYYDTEEGLGSVMEQALEGKYKEVGIPAYISAGAAYFDNKDFRGTFDLKWKLSVLEGLKDGEVPSAEKVEKAQKLAYNGTFRIFRGTDTLPWFKDIAYYNGAQEVWKHLEEIRGDDLKLSFLLMGKANAANDAHERLLYETSTK